MILSKLKAWGMAILAVAVAVLYGLLQRSEKKRIEDEHEDIENAQRVERQDSQITTEGLQDEAKTRDEVKDTSISDYFRKS